MLRRSFDGARQRQHFGAVAPSSARHVRELHVPLGDGSGLVEYDRRDPARPLEDLGALDQNAELGAATGADHERGGRRQTERARARDDQHRDRGGEGRSRVAGHDEPAGERGERKPEDDRHEHGRDTVDEPLDGRLPGLRFRDQSGDLRERRLLADLRRADDETSVGVDGRTGDVRPWPHVDRHGLARQHRLVDGRVALDDHAVGGNLLSGPDEHKIAGHDVLDRDGDLHAVPKHVSLLRAEIEQCANRRTRAPLRARLEVAADEDQGRDHGGDLEVRVRVVEDEERDNRPPPRGQRPDRDQRVHRRREVARVQRSGAMEPVPGPEDDGRREHERKPFPALELERRDHRERRQRNGQRDRDGEPHAQRARAILGSAASARRASVVAGRLDRPDEIRDRDAVGVVADGRLLGRVVDRRLDPFELVQLPLDTGRAGGAGHPLERELDPRFRRLGQRHATS